MWFNLFELYFESGYTILKEIGGNVLAFLIEYKHGFMHFHFTVPYHHSFHKIPQWWQWSRQ